MQCYKCGSHDRFRWVQVRDGPDGAKYRVFFCVCGTQFKLFEESIKRSKARHEWEFSR